MTIQEKFNLLGKYTIKLVQWQDKRKARRLWLNRDKGNYEFICEKHTIEECLDCAIEYVNSLK